MQRLADILLRDGVRQRLVLELARLVEDEVAGGRGLFGAAVRRGYGLVRSLRSDFVQHALDELLEAFVSELDPLYREHGSPRSFAQYLASHREVVAQRMLRVTDSRLHASRSVKLRCTYDALSPLARPNLERVVPQLAQVIQRFVDELADPTLCASAA